MNPEHEPNPANESLLSTSNRRQHLGWLAGGAASLIGLAAGEPAFAAPSVFPGSSWATKSPAAAGMSSSRLSQAIRLASSKGGSGFVVRHGYKVASWGDVNRRYKTYSATKGFGSILLGLALDDGRAALNDLGRRWLPEIGTPP